MKYKKRPCPGGCGNIDHRPPQTLCPDCRRRLRLGEKREKEIEALETSGEKIRVAIGTQFHYSTGAFLSFLDIKDTDVLRTLVHLIGLENCHGSTYKEAHSIHYKYDRTGGWRNHPTQYVWATPEQANNIKLILDYIKLVIEKAYSDGQANGRSLILQLATAGTKELNQITTGKDQEPTQ